MEKHSLPEDLRSKASTAGGEQAWRMADVEGIILAARNLAMACIGSCKAFGRELCGVGHKATLVCFANRSPAPHNAGPQKNSYVVDHITAPRLIADLPAASTQAG